MTNFIKIILDLELVYVSDTNCYPYILTWVRVPSDHTLFSSTTHLLIVLHCYTFSKRVSVNCFPKVTQNDYSLTFICSVGGDT